MIDLKVARTALCFALICGFANVGYGFTLTCQITKGASEEWRIPERITFEVDRSTLRAKVIDPISQAIGQSIVFAEVRDDSDAKLVLVWEVNGFPRRAMASRGASVLNETDYRAVFYKKRKRFSLTANSVRWQPGETGRGHCVQS